MRRQEELWAGSCMHELSLTEGVLRIVEREAAAQSFSRVLAVRLEIGKLSHVEPEAMRFCFEAVTRGSLAEGAQLEIIRVPGLAWCMACAKQIAINQRYEPCPDCGGHQLELLEGEEMRVKELEVE